MNSIDNGACDFTIRISLGTLGRVADVDKPYLRSRDHDRCGGQANPLLPIWFGACERCLQSKVASLRVCIRGAVE